MAPMKFGFWYVSGGLNPVMYPTVLWIILLNYEKYVNNGGSGTR